MLNSGKHFEFFKDFIHYKPSAVNLVNQYFVEGLSNEEKPNLTLDEYGVFCVQNMAFYGFIRKEIKGEKYRIFFKEYIEQEKVGLRKDLSENLIGKSLDERVEFISLQLQDIKGLIDVCRESKYRKVHTILGDFVISALMEIGTYFLEQCKKGFSADEYQYFHHYFNGEKQEDSEKSSGLELEVKSDIQIKQTRSKIKSVDNNLITYNLNVTSEVNKPTRIIQLEDLFYNLNGSSGTYKYIKCTLSEFQGIFGYLKKKGSIYWYGDINELHYLILSLFDKGFIKDRAIWKIGVACFKNADGDINITSLRTINNPKHTAHIDSAIEHI